MKMEVVVERVHSAKEYLQYWTTAMADVHWFRRRRLFDYNCDEMVEEIAGEFGKPGSIHLVARLALSGDGSQLFLWNTEVAGQEKPL